MSRTISEAERQQARFTMWTPARAGLRLGVSAAQVRGYIEDGELEAKDMSRKDAKRKTYLIRPEAVEEFDRRRTLNATAGDPSAAA